jgi:hypothetical protein
MEVLSSQAQVANPEVYTSLEAFTKANMKKVLEISVRHVFRDIYADDLADVKPSQDYLDFMNALERGDHLDTSLFPL